MDIGKFFIFFSNNMFTTIIIIVYICLYFFIIIYFRNRSGEKKLFSSIINILKNSKDEKTFYLKANVVFGKYIQKNSYSKKEYTSLQDVIENIIYYSETNKRKILEKYFGIVISEEEKDKIYSFYNLIKTDFPYDILEQYDKELIKNLYKSIDNNDKPTRENLINQLIKEIHVKNKKIQKQSKSNTIMLIISIVGIILNIVFCILSIVR